MVPYLKKFDNLLLVLGYSLSLSVSFFIWSLSSFHQSSHSLSSQNSHFLFHPFLLSLIGLWWLGWVLMGCQLLWWWWVIDQVVGCCGCGGSLMGLWWWVMLWGSMDVVGHLSAYGGWVVGHAMGMVGWLVAIRMGFV